MHLVPGLKGGMLVKVLAPLLEAVDILQFHDDAVAAPSTSPLPVVYSWRSSDDL